MELDKLVEMAGKLKQKKEKRSELLKKLQREGLLSIFLICEEASYDCHFLTKESERERYCKALFDACVWGINVSKHKRK